MQPIDPNYLDRRRQELDLDRQDFLAQVQQLMDRRYAGRVRAVSFNYGILRLVTPSAVLASELRLNQVAILQELSGRQVLRLQITIATIN